MPDDLLAVISVCAVRKTGKRELAVLAQHAQNNHVSAMVEKIFEQVRALSASEQEELWKLLADEQSRTLDEWEKQVKADSASGKLDHLLHELTEDIAAGRVTPLHEVVDEP